MKIRLHRSADARYKFAFLDRIRHRDGTQIRQIRWGRCILSFVFTPKSKPDVEAGKTLEEAADNWEKGGFGTIAETLRNSRHNTNGELPPKGGSESKKGVVGG